MANEGLSADTNSRLTRGAFVFKAAAKKQAVASGADQLAAGADKSATEASTDADQPVAGADQTAANTNEAAAVEAHSTPAHFAPSSIAPTVDTSEGTRSTAPAHFAAGSSDATTDEANSGVSTSATLSTSNTPSPSTSVTGSTSAAPDSETTASSSPRGFHQLFKPALFIPVSVLIFELALRLSTASEPYYALLVIGLFALAWGCLLELPPALIKNERVSAGIRVAILALLGVLFSVQYFVFRKFKLFYDPKTIVTGATDAMGQFGDSAAALILSPSGLVHLTIFLAPALIAAFFACRKRLKKQVGPTPLPSTASDSLPSTAPDSLPSAAPDSSHPAAKAPLQPVTAAPIPEPRHLLTTAVLAAVCALGLTVSLGNLWSLWTEHYNFQSAVSSFGLLTSLGKEAHAAIFKPVGSMGSLVLQDGGALSQGSSSSDASSVTDAERTEASAASASGKTEPASYEPSVMDIDFEALAQTTDGTWADVDRYVASLTPSSKNKYTGLFEGYNLIFISAEALSSEAIRPDTTPTLWRMAEKGIQLTDYYQFDNAGTTGGECANIFGLYATEGGSSVKMTADHNNYLTMGNALNRLGYEGWAFHNNSYEFYDRHLTHNNLGYSHGYMGYGNGMEQWVEWQWPQSDLEMVKGTFDNIYGNVERFNVYYMSVSGHSDYGPGENKMAEKNKDAVADLDYSEPIKNYLASNVELDHAMEYLLKQLKDKGIDKRTVVVVAADHFPYGLDDDAPVGQLNYTSELYGYEVSDVFQRDHNRAIIWSASLEGKDPIVANGPCASIDLLPTLLNLFGCEWDSRLLPGRDVLSDAEPLVFDTNYNWKSARGTYWASTGKFEPTEGADVPEGYVEATSATVARKLSYCEAVLTTDYWRHVFGNPAPVSASKQVGNVSLCLHAEFLGDSTRKCC
ncbi:MAG: sulfatase-like hydrolase/transferase [Atopobiaceae bacterium]|nr:sulfatase-like hydrolase/transferase [Atopobiaceae bacterium]